MRAAAIVRFAMVLLLGAAASPARAQLLQLPQGSTEGFFGGPGRVDPTHPGRSWVVTADGSTGRDTLPQVSTTGQTRSVSATAATALFDTVFQAGSTTRNVRLSGGGFWNRQTLASDQPTGANLEARGAYGLRSGLAASFSMRYQPISLASSIGMPAGVQPGSAETAAGGQLPNGVLSQRWLATTTSANVFHNWSPRHRFDVFGSAWQWRPLEGSGLESRSLSMTVQDGRNVNPRLNVRVGGTLQRNLQTELGGDRRTLLARPELTVRAQRRLSPLRSLTFELRGGVAYASVDPDFGVSSSDVEPVVNGVLIWTLPGWSLSLNASRDVDVLNVVSSGPFRNDQVGLQVGVTAARRLTLTSGVGYTRGAALADTRGNFTALSINGRAQMGLTRWFGLFGAYSYYKQDLTRLQISGAAIGDYGRHVIRVGGTLWLPMYGRF